VKREPQTSSPLTFHPSLITNKKMYNALLFIKEQLTDNATITAQIPAANIYPVIASAEVAGDFVVYNVQREGRYTKDLLSTYSSEIDVFGDDILEATQKADIIELELTNHDKIIGTSASVAYSVDLQKAFVKLIFTFKI